MPILAGVSSQPPLPHHLCTFAQCANCTKIHSALTPPLLSSSLFPLPTIIKCTLLFNLYILFCNQNYMYFVYRLNINIKHLHYYTNILFTVDKSMVTFPIFCIALCFSKIAIFLFYITPLSLSPSSSLEPSFPCFRLDYLILEPAVCLGFSNYFLGLMPLFPGIHVFWKNLLSCFT